MDIFFFKDLIKTKSKLDHVQIYHNAHVPAHDIESVLYPLFRDFYQYKDFRHMIETANHIFLAFDFLANRPIASALVNNDGKQGGLYIVLFGVRKSTQHGGVGTKLLKTIIQWARQTHHSFIFLHVNEANTKAIGLYKKVGFRKAEHIPDFYRNTPKEHPGAFRMVLTL